MFSLTCPVISTLICSWLCIARRIQSTTMLVPSSMSLLTSYWPLPNLQEDDEDAPERRRMSADGQRAAEKALEPEMVNHVVDALFDRCAQPCTPTRPHKAASPQAVRGCQSRHMWQPCTDTRNCRAPCSCCNAAWSGNGEPHSALNRACMLFVHVRTLSGGS